MARDVVPMDDRQIVAALCAQNASGLAAAYDTYARRLHAYSRSILHDHDAAADAVHDAFLIAGQRIRELRDPQRLRPWLYAIVRCECLRQLRIRSRIVELTGAEQLRDESIDLDAGLRTEQYRQLVWTAAAGLNPREHEVLELSVRHGLDSAELAAALGVSVNHAHTLMSRARQHLKQSLTVVIVARTGRRDCAALDGLLTGWDGVLTVLWRKRIARHIERCVTCGGTQRREVRASALLATVPFVALPLALRDRVLNTAADPQLAAYRTGLATRAGRFNRDGFPRSAVAARRAGLAARPRLGVPAGAAVLFLGGLVLLLHGPASDLVAGSSEPTTSIGISTTTAERSSPTPAGNPPALAGSPPTSADAPHTSSGAPPTSAATTTGPAAGTPPAPQPANPASRPAGRPSPSRPPVLPVAVPGVVGLTLDPARSTLQAAGLTIGAASVRNGVSQDHVGVVVDQFPAAGRSVDPGSPVALTVGGVPASTLVTVPDVVGLTREQADQKLRSVGLRLGTVSRQNLVLSNRDGVVLDQTPAPGESVEPGSRVALTVGVVAG